jgi:predicted Rossmann fold flavoprotein
MEKFDVVVIGAGPAGMMAAGRAAESGAKVVILDRNKTPGRKLLMTGKGRCNIAQDVSDDRELVEQFGKNGRFLFSSLAIFGVRDTVDFFNKRGLQTKVERGGRIFPVSDKAEDVLDVLTKYLSENNVRVISNTKITGVEKYYDRITKLLLQDEKLAGNNYILCTGGKSYPGTGSTGDGFRWAKELGHHVTDLIPALVPLRIKEDWVKEAQGLSLKNVEISIFLDGKKQDSRFGEAIFTHFGMSGPIILDMSKEVGKMLKNGEVKLSLDLKPALDFQKLDKRLQRDFLKYNNRMFKNCLDELLPQKLINIVIRLSGIDPDRYVNNITRDERQELVKLLKGMNMTVTGLMGFDNALITSGGIALNEVDPKTMKSKLIENLFFAGEILDLDGPTGGYNLQVCWTTGYVAGQNAVDW